MQPRALHARAGRRIPYVQRVRVPARREEVEISLAFETELLPRLAAVAAAQKPEGIDEPGARRRMAAAIEISSGRREAHVVVLGSGRLGPVAVFVHSKTMMARDHQALAVGAVSQAVNVHERGLRRNLRCKRRCEADKNPMHCFHCFPWLRVISPRTSRTSRDLHWLLM